MLYEVITEMLTSLRYDILKNGMVIASMKNNIHKMDISKLLKDFNNFSQNEITNEQLSGLFSCKDVHSRYVIKDRITSYNVCYTKLLRIGV